MDPKPPMFAVTFSAFVGSTGLPGLVEKLLAGI